MRVIKLVVILETNLPAERLTAAFIKEEVKYRLTDAEYTCVHVEPVKAEYRRIEGGEGMDE